MGDHADQLFDDWLTGLDNDDGYDDFESFAPNPKTCRACGVGNLFWALVDGKWRLHDEEAKIHVCAVKPLPAEPVAFVRASGECICQACGKPYYRHPKDGPLFEGYQWLRRICDGRLVKL